MSGRKIEICRNCGDAIIFGIDLKKRRVALNPDPVNGGEIKFMGDESNSKITVNLSMTNPGYVRHSKTCPDSHKSRKRDRTKKRK